MNKALIKAVSDLISKTEKAGLILSDEKEISYGVQLKFSKNDSEISLNVYYSGKKGISTVVGGSPKNPLRPLLMQIINKDAEISRADHSWELWAGTDESGKGDFFGALVVCGFIVEKKDMPHLRKLGIRDSKLLRDNDIIRLAKDLHKNFRDNIELLILKPRKYNELYKKFRDGNKKLNEMLAWMHSRVILNLYKKHKFEGAVVDKFASDKTLVGSLKDMQKIKLIHKIKAEEDIAVAAASIIARYHFIESINSLSQKYGLDFPKGASTKVVKTGKEFIEKFSPEKLNEVGKLHFKTREKIL